MAIPALFGNVDPNQQVLTQDEIKRRRMMAQQLIGENSGFEPLSHPLQAVAKVLGAGVGAYKERQAGAAQGAFDQRRRDGMASLLKGMGGQPSSSSSSAFTPFSSAPASTGPAPSSPAGGAMAASGGLRDGIASTASALGIDPVDLATAISYETAGTFDPTKRGPTTQWGQHRGLIQFGEPQARKYGVDWNDPLGSQLGPNGAVANYLRDTGVKPGMGLMEIYSAINAGGVGRNNRTDANNGGAPGTVADKVNTQMAGHRAKASALFDGYQQQPVQVASLDQTIGFAQPTGGGMIATPQNGAIGNPDNVRPYSGPGAQVDMPPQLGGMRPSVPAPAPVAPPQAQSAPLQAPMQATAYNAPQGGSQQQAMASALLGGAPQQVAQAGGIDRALIAQLLNDPATEDIGQSLLMQGLEQQQAAAAMAQRQAYERQQLIEQRGYDAYLRNDERQYDTGVRNDERQHQTGVRQEGFQREDARNAYTDGRQLSRDAREDYESDRSYGLSRDQLTPTSVREYEYAVSQGYAGTFADFEQAQRKAGAASTNVNVGEGNKFYETLDAEQAKIFSGMSDAGMQGRSKLAQIEALEPLLEASETGGLAVLRQAAGEFGINTDGLSDIQAAQALINRMVPEQRAPGTGPMSDADLALFKESLPRMINQPGGNRIIIGLMKGITNYQIQIGEIADRVADRSITPAQAREQIRSMQNPLEGFDPAAFRRDEGTSSNTNTPQQGAIQDGYRFKGGDPADPASWEPVV